MLFALVLLLSVLLVVRRRWAVRRQRALADQLKTNFTHVPIIGHTYKFLGTHEDQMATVQEIGRDAIEMGGISKFMYFDQLMLCIVDPAVAEVILKESLEKHEVHNIIGLIATNSTLFSPVPIWRPRRKVNASIFNLKYLLQFGKVLSKNASTMVDLLEQEVNKGTFSIWKYTTEYSFNSICENILGVQVNNSHGGKFRAAVEELLLLAAYALCRPWLKNKFILRCHPIYEPFHRNKTVLISFLTKIIQEERKSVVSQRGQTCCGDVLPSFIRLNLESCKHNKYSDEELYEECLTMVLAGYDTSATVLAFTMVMLSRHPDVQKKVYAELQQVLGEDSERPICMEDLPELKYVEAVIKETLRLYPIGPVAVRKLDKDVVLPSGLTLVQGCSAMINVWGMHRHPDYWGLDADHFRPERFLHTTAKQQTAYMPFSYGPRNCVGYRYAMISMKIFVSSVVRRFKLVAPPGVALAEPLRTKLNINTKHCDGYQIQIQRRPLETGVLE